MPTTGAAKYPYPNASAVPDVPADFLILGQRIAKMNGAGIAYVADATARAALVTNTDAFNVLVVAQTDTGEYWKYDGTDWIPFPDVPHGEYTYSRSVGNAASTTLNAAPTLVGASSSVNIADYVTPHSTGLTFDQAGVYSLFVSALWDGTLATGRSYIQVTVGAVTYRFPMSTEDRMSAYLEAHIPAATTVTVAIFQTTGGTRTVTGRIHVTRVGRI